MLFIFLLLFLLNLIIFFKINELSQILNIYDVPDNKLKLHKTNVPIIGGIILALILVSCFCYQIFF